MSLASRFEIYQPQVRIRSRTSLAGNVSPARRQRMCAGSNRYVAEKTKGCGISVNFTTLTILCHANSQTCQRPAR